MAKVTTKRQLTVPKLIADQYGIKAGDHLEWVAAGDAIRVIPPNSRRGGALVRTVEQRLKLFRHMLERQRKREAHPPKAEAYRERPPKPHETARAWRREDLYIRGGSR